MGRLDDPWTGCGVEGRRPTDTSRTDAPTLRSGGRRAVLTTSTARSSQATPWPCLAFEKGGVDDGRKRNRYSAAGFQPHLSGVRPHHGRDHADRRLPVVLRLSALRRGSEAQARRLLRLLFLWRREVSARSRKGRVAARRVRGQPSARSTPSGEPCSMNGRFLDATAVGATRTLAALNSDGIPLVQKAEKREGLDALEAAFAACRRSERRR